MTTLAPGVCLSRCSKSLSVETQDELVIGSIVQNLAIAGTSKPVSKALSDSGNRSLNNRTSLGDRLSSKRSFIHKRLCAPPPIRRRKRKRQGSHPVRVADS